MSALLSRIRHTLARPTTGLRALLCLLAISLLFAGGPAADLHAHAGGDHDHDHHHHGMVDPGDGPAPEDDAAPATLHVHDAAGVTQALAEPEAPIVASVATAFLAGAPPTTGLRLSPRPPPHRPPIA